MSFVTVGEASFALKIAATSEGIGSPVSGHVRSPF
jgi:hypothetical protein